MIFGLIAINEVFVKFFLGKDFQDVKYVLYIIVFNIMFVGWTNILGYQVLVVRNKKQGIYVVDNDSCLCQCSC